MKSLFGILVAGLIFAACAGSNRVPVTGSFYNGASSALGATSNQVGSKRGEACASSILGVVGLGDASIETAAKAGGVSTISHVDSTNFALLGIWAKTCTVVYGN